MPAENVMTPEFRVSYPYMFKPQPAMEAGKDPKFSLTMLFTKGADLSALKKAVKACATEKWGPDEAKWPDNLRSPFRDQKEKAKQGVLPEGYEAGAFFITATGKQRPGLVDAKVIDILEEREFYPGCYARATVRAFAYDNKGNRGVAFGLQNAQKLREGEPLGGRSRPSDDFEPVADAGGEAPAGGAKSVFD